MTREISHSGLQVIATLVFNLSIIGTLVACGGQDAQNESNDAETTDGLSNVLDTSRVAMSMPRETCVGRQIEVGWMAWPSEPTDLIRCRDPLGEVIRTVGPISSFYGQFTFVPTTAGKYSCVYRSSSGPDGVEARGYTTVFSGGFSGCW